MTETQYPPRWLTLTRALVGYIGYGVGGAMFIAVLLPLSLPLALMPRLRTKALRLVLHLYCALLTRVYLPALGIYRVEEISGHRRAAVHEPAVYVANHRGRLDGPLILGMVRNTGVLIKARYARQPVYSSLVRHLDFVNVDPHSLESLAGALKQCREMIASGKNLLVFPEGTRATSHNPLPFKDFAFRIAMDCGVPIIPITVHSDLPFMAKISGSHFPRRKFSYRVRFLEPMMREGNETSAQFAERTRGLIIDNLDALDAGTEWAGEEAGVEQ